MSDTQPSCHARRSFRAIAAFGYTALLLSVSAAALPQGTPVEARLLTPISTYRAKAGMPISAALATAVCSSGTSVLPEGTELRGEVTRVHRVGLGLIHESAGLKLEFSQLVLPDGQEYPVKTLLSAVDNARERVDRKGNIHGIRATATLSNRFGERIIFGVLGHPAAMIPLFVAESELLHFPEPEIAFRRGTEMQLSVEFPEELGTLSACPMPQEETTPEDWVAMQSVVNQLPYWTFSKRQPQPMDLVNLLFIGSRNDVERAFAAAGWLGSRPNSMRAGLAAIRAIAENGAFSDAPMRTLLLDGREPDMRLQKSLDTFEKRDHLRIWNLDRRLNGEPVWASAATRDLGTTFGLHPFGFTHEIQGDVDLERDKVVHDLLFTGCVDSVSYVQRPQGVRETGEAYRKGVSTDARVAMVSLNGCTQPREDFDTVEPSPQPGRVVRVIRRITLTARNHFLRDNLIYRSADAARLAYLALRNFDRQARQEGAARRLESATFLTSPPVRK